MSVTVCFVLLVSLEWPSQMWKLHSFLCCIKTFLNLCNLRIKIIKVMKRREEVPLLCPLSTLPNKSKYFYFWCILPEFLYAHISTCKYIFLFSLALCCFLKFCTKGSITYTLFCICFFQIYFGDYSSLVHTKHLHSSFPFLSNTWVMLHGGGLTLIPYTSPLLMGIKAAPSLLLLQFDNE